MFPGDDWGVKMVVVAGASSRPYRGVKPADRRAQRRNRLLDAGLSILGSQTPSEALTVRGVCARAGLSARYFYESFSDRDYFVAAVYDWVIGDLTATTQAAVTATPPEEQARAGMANVVHTVTGDERVGRLLFSAELADPVVVRKRDESNAFLASLLEQHAVQVLQQPQDEHVRATSHFAVGGVGQALSAWVAGRLKLTSDEMVGHLAAMLDRLAEPALGQQRNLPQVRVRIE
jgi:AcrR family transcriptional regulator